MTLRGKIFLLGLLAVASTCLALAHQYGNYTRQSQELEAISRNIKVVDALALAAHELQQERGLTTLALAGVDDEALTGQIRRTDAALAILAAASRDFPDVVHELAQLRAEAITSSLNPMAARDRYTILLQSLLDEMSLLTRKPEAAVAGEDITAHTHLVAAKEYLGQMRATLGYWLKDDRDGYYALQSLIRLKGLFDEERRKFIFSASPELRAAFDAGQGNLDALATLDAVSQTIANCHPALGLEAPKWWAMATTAMEHLKGLETHSLRHIDQQAEARLSHLRSTLAFGGALTVTAGLAALLLAVSAVYTLLHALKGLLVGLERVSTNQDFHLRIPADGRDEIGAIARGFNRLLEVAEQSIREKDALAATDPLTGIHNRLCFARVLLEEAERKRRNGASMALILFDIDGFKRINDTHGHDVGDMVLIALTQRITQETRACDFFCRWGGEEFVLLLRDDGCDTALVVAEKIRLIIATTEFPTVGRLTCSFGIALWTSGDSDVSLVKRADQALYAAKHGGRNRVSCEQGAANACPGHAACSRCRDAEG